MGALGVGAVQGGMQILGAKMQADAGEAQSEWSARQNDFNSAMVATQRREVEQKGDADAQLRMRDTKAMLGEQKASLAANGIDVGSEVSMNLQEDTLRRGREDVNTIKNNAWREAWGLQVKESDLKMQSGFTRAGGQLNAATTIASGGLGAASSVFRGYTDDLANGRRTTSSSSPKKDS